MILLFSSTVFARSQCDFYQDISNKLQCSQDDYFLRFGEKYCRVFIAKAPRFSSEGQNFLRQVRQCLIQKIANGVKHGALSCSNMDELAMDHHINCYVKSGFCTLSGSDRRELFLLTWRAMLESNILEMSWKINSACNEELSRPR